MTGHQWLFFVGIPAFFAIILLIVDYRRVRRRRFANIVVSPFEEEKPHTSAPEPTAYLPAGIPPSTKQHDPLAELEKLISAKHEASPSTKGSRS